LDFEDPWGTAPKRGEATSGPGPTIMQNFTPSRRSASPSPRCVRPPLTADDISGKSHSSVAFVG